MTDSRLAPIAQLLRDHNLDAVAIVPGSNFRRLFAQDFHLMERPLVVIIPKTGVPAAVVPQLELASFEKIGFPGTVHPWRDEDGYQDAFAAAAARRQNGHG